MQDFEKLGVFYLGQGYDLGQSKATGDLVLYDARDLTTHAVCVGMTGSGKTGLCLALLEEAAIDGVPVIAIDPKGDLGNLLLGFPNLQPADFRPWLDAGEAERRGITLDQLAEKTATTWREGLAASGQDGARIARLQKACDMAIYTPGSEAGLSLSILRSFAAPGAALDADARRDRLESVVSGLLTLIGVVADPLKSREHILLSQIIDGAWSQGRDVDLVGLIRAIGSPPFQQMGAFDLESFFPQKDRNELALTLNNLLASPSFAAWTKGEALDVQRLLWTATGQPRISIISIAHLNDAERMFFVTLLFNEVVAWMRGQAGTSSLRAVMFMDEVFGFLPPTAMPPSKKPLLTLLKQARAFGLGIVLASQNPVDLDYKALSNAGTWFLGRLQTERDKARVIEGLEGASAAAGTSFDRAKLEATLGALTNRVFLMNNVHDDQPVVMQTRWALSFLRGPLTRSQIQTLMAARKTAAAASPGSIGAAAPAATAAAVSASGSANTPASVAPVVAAGITEYFAPLRAPAPAGSSIVYRASLMGQARLHYVLAKAQIDEWQEMALVADLPARDGDDPWESAEPLPLAPTALTASAQPGAAFVATPAVSQAKNFTRWSDALADALYRTSALTLWQCAAPKAVSKPGETEGDFRARLSLAAREGRDAQAEKLKAAYAPKLAALQRQIAQAEQRKARESAQFQQQTVQSAISIGATVLGALFGRKKASLSTLGRATTAVRGIGRTVSERQDIARADATVEQLQTQLADLDAQLQGELADAQAAPPASSFELTEVPIKAKKSDIAVTRLAILWIPWRQGPDGSSERWTNA